jgi:predicted O-linked N-acetylglucosamine transferase (SPINDLY family)
MNATLQRALQTGLVHHQAGRLADAEKFYRQVRSAAPALFDGLHLSGVLAYQQNRHAEAVDLLARARRADPRHALCAMRLGLALAALDRHTEAETHYRAALKLDPRVPETWNNLAISLKTLGRAAEARDAYRQAIALKPEYFDAHDRLGALLADTQGLAAGIPHFRKALELKPDYAPAWCNLGVALLPEGKFAEALDCFSRALAHDPTLTQALVGRGLAFQQSYRLAEAASTYAEALARDPAHHEARSARLLTLHYLDGIPREELFAEHVAFGRATADSPLTPATPVRSKIKDRASKISVAFLSPDLRAHSVAYFLEPILQHLDRARFELTLYHDHFQVDAMSEKLRAHATRWRNFVGQSHVAVERQIRADAPDILIDLAGHTGLNRLPVFARRGAPVQISYLGYPDTTGLAAMDFRFVDAITDPSEDDQRFHTEELIRFAPTAWAYAPPASAPEPGGGEALAGAFRPVTFGSFNNFAKISDATLALWARVLAATPDSRLLLKGHGLDSAELAPLLAEKLARLEVAPDRVELLGRTPNIASHLATYARVDVALDAFPYHGTTTTCEALWMGVPVVTLLGDRHAARVGASLLTAAGHPEWIAHSTDEYVALATRLAAAPEIRAALRRTLRADLRRGPLLDHAAQAKRFGDALLACWERRE